LYAHYVGVTAAKAIMDDGLTADLSDVPGKALIRGKLTEFDIDIPADAIFSNMGDGIYRFTMSNENAQTAGELTCVYYDDGKIKTINNSIIHRQAVREIEIISEREAYQRLEVGCFVPPFLQISSINVTSVKLEYSLDTKGFYMPVYIFEAVVDGSEATIMIPGLIRS